MDDNLRLKLENYVRACNAVRSSTTQASREGSRSKGAINLQYDRKQHQRTLMELEVWVEQKAREALGMEQYNG